MPPGAGALGGSRRRGRMPFYLTQRDACGRARLACPCSARALLHGGPTAHIPRGRDKLAAVG